jgi:RNA polymerase sigma factor (sigma-70 family)
VDWEEIYRRLAADREDVQAWRTLQQRVRAWARAQFHGRSADFVEDSVAEVAARVAVAFPRAHGPATFHGFVLGHWLNVRRQLLQTIRRPLVALEEDLEVPAPEVDREELDEQDLEWLRQALHELPDRERRAVALRYLEELSSAQIATALGVTEVNARRVVFNGLAHLRQRRGPCRPGRRLEQPRLAWPGRVTPGTGSDL